MTLKEAQSIIREVYGRQYSYLEAWGLSTIRKAVNTIDNRVSATEADKELAEDVKNKLSRKW